jgi:hypothetical protein
VYSKKNETRSYDDNENIAIQQLQFFYQKDVDNKRDVQHSYVKAFFLHHLLDYFTETRVNINDIDLVFEKFIQKKVIVEIADSEGNIINFQEDVDDLFNLLKENRSELYKDLRGKYFNES